MNATEQLVYDYGRAVRRRSDEQRLGARHMTKRLESLQQAEWELYQRMVAAGVARGNIIDKTYRAYYLAGVMDWSLDKVRRIFKLEITA